jgi:uracil-DNA glycosylase
MSFIPWNTLPAGWKKALGSTAESQEMRSLDAFLERELRHGKVIYPSQENILRSLCLVDFTQVRVVILGQDPYHGPGQAIGLSFAVPNELKKKPPSLKNIFKEIESDLGVSIDPAASDLKGWVKQGVLLLNTVLTVRDGEPLSHHEQGWECFTRSVLQVLDDRDEPMVFILWGSHAQKLGKQIRNSRHILLECVHPSPLSAYRGFFGSKIFSKTNEALIQIGHSPIRWQETQ